MPDDSSDRSNVRTVLVTNARSPQRFAIVAVAVLATYFLLQWWFFSKRTQLPDLEWMDQWDVVTSCGETVESRQMALSEAFANPLDVADVPAGLTRLFQSLTEGAQSGDEDVLVAAIDWPVLLQTVRESKFFDDSRTADDLSDWVDPIYPWRWKLYSVLHVRASSAERARVLAVLDDGDGRFHEVRWWCTVRNDQWLIYDWEIIDFGLRETTEIALSWTLSEYPSLAHYDNYLSMTRSDPSVFAQELPVPRALHDPLYVQLAYEYLELGQFDVALAMSSRVRHPEVAFGGLIAKAHAELFLGRADDAEESTDVLESHVGKSLKVQELRNAILAFQSGINTSAP